MAVEDRVAPAGEERPLPVSAGRGAAADEEAAEFSLISMGAASVGPTPEAEEDGPASAPAAPFSRGPFPPTMPSIGTGPSVSAGRAARPFSCACPD